MCVDCRHCLGYDVTCDILSCSLSSRPLAKPREPQESMAVCGFHCGMDAWYSSGGKSDLTAASSLCLLRRHTSLRSSSAVSMSLLPDNTAQVLVRMGIVSTLPQQDTRCNVAAQMWYMPASACVTGPRQYSFTTNDHA